MRGFKNGYVEISIGMGIKADMGTGMSGNVECELFSMLMYDKVSVSRKVSVQPKYDPVHGLGMEGRM